jgi:hypothetical protein
LKTGGKSEDRRGMTTINGLVSSCHHTWMFSKISQSPLCLPFSCFVTSSSGPTTIYTKENGDVYDVYRSSTLMNRQESSNFQPLVMTNRTPSYDWVEELFSSLDPSVLTQHTWPCVITKLTADPEDFWDECQSVNTVYWVRKPLLL